MDNSFKGGGTMPKIGAKGEDEARLVSFKGKGKGSPSMRLATKDCPAYPTRSPFTSIGIVLAGPSMVGAETEGKLHAHGG